MTGEWNKIDMKTARKICDQKGLIPVRIQGTDIVHIGKRTRLDVVQISWDEFEKILEKKNFGIFEHKGFMRIMKL